MHIELLFINFNVICMKIGYGDLCESYHISYEGCNAREIKSL